LLLTFKKAIKTKAKEIFCNVFGNKKVKRLLLKGEKKIKREAKRNEAIF